MTEAVDDETTDLLNTLDRWDSLIKDMRAELREVLRGLLDASPQFMGTRAPVHSPRPAPAIPDGCRIQSAKSKHPVE